MLPVFICGSGRSGTTLLGAMLGTHRECLCIPESPFKIDIIRSSFDTGKIDVRKTLKMLKVKWRFQIWGIDLESSFDLKKDFVSVQEFIEWIVKEYGEKVGKKEPSIWVDHTNTNSKYASLVFEFFPASKMIHIVRDGRAVANSIMSLDWGPNTIENAASFWMTRVLRAHVMENIWKGQALRIRFEDLLKDTEKTLRTVCSFLNIEYQPEMTKATGFRVPFYTSKQHSLIGKNLDVDRINDWEKKLTGRQIEIFESIAGDLLVSHGYSLKFGMKAKKITSVEKFKLNLQEAFKQKINKFRRRQRIKKGVEMASRYLEP